MIARARAALLAGAGAVALWWLSRRRSSASSPAPAANVDVGPLTAPEGVTIPPEGVTLYPSTLKPLPLVPAPVYQADPASYGSPTGLTPGEELEALNRFRAPIT